MKRKTKFMTAILSQDEWQYIQSAMEIYEDICEKNYNHQIPSVKKIWRKAYHIVHHFNSISVNNIEDMADKIEKQRRKEKKSGKKNS